MPTRDDVLFCEMAVTLGLMAEDQVQECLSSIAELERQGQAREAAEVAVEKRFLDAVGAVRVMRDCGRSVLICGNGQCQAVFKVNDTIPLDATPPMACPKCGFQLAHASLKDDRKALPIAGTVDKSGNAVPDPPRDMRIGTQIAHFLILDKLGEGGMGKVYLVRNLRLDCLRALKVIERDAGDSDDAEARQRELERFIGEARAAARLRHDNVVCVHDVASTDIVHYIEMEFVEGQALSKRIKETGGLPLPEATRIVAQIAAALEAAHEHGIIHRDIKPANILLTSKGRPMLADFGLAKDLEVTTGLTLSGQVLGTVPYMSPEQCRGDSLNHQTDIYSLGVLYYEALTGHVPFSGSVTEILRAHQVSPLPDPRNTRAEVTDECWQVVKKMCAKSLTQRYRSARELIEELERLPGYELDGTDSTRTMEPWTQPIPGAKSLSGGRRRTYAIIVAAALVLCVSAALLIRAVGTKQGPSKPTVTSGIPNVGMSVYGQRLDERGNVLTVVLGPGDMLYSDEQFQVHYRTDREAYIYVLLCGATGAVQQLFPDPGIQVSNLAREGVDYVIPASDIWFTLDENAGLETICLLASVKPLAELPDIIGEIRVAGAIPESEREQAELLAKADTERGVNGMSKSLSSLYVPQVSEARVTKVMDVIRSRCAAAKALTFRHENR